MGIFDNVNMQQMIPAIMGGLSAGAAYGDPRSGPMLAESGWKGVQAYMQQQRQQQEKLEFEERKKLMQEEQAQRERGLQIREKEEMRNSEVQLDEDVFSQKVIPGVLAWKKANPDKEFTPSALWEVTKLTFDSTGRPPKAALAMKNYAGLRVVAGEDGPVVFRLGPGGVGLEMYQGDSTTPLNLFGKGFGKDQAKMFEQQPELWKSTADGMRARAGEMTDPKERTRLLNGAKTLESLYEGTRKDKDKIDYQALAHADRQMHYKHERQREQWHTQFGKKTDGLYPGGPPNESPEAAQRRADQIDEGYNNMLQNQIDESLTVGIAAVGTRAGQLGVERQLKKGVDKPAEFSGEDEIAYQHALRKVSTDKRLQNLTYDQKIAVAREAVERSAYLRKTREATQKVKQPREELLVKPEPKAAPPPVLTPRPRAETPAGSLAGSTLTEGAYRLSERASAGAMKAQLEGAIKARDIAKDVNTGVYRALTQAGEGILRDLRRLNKGAGRALFGSE